MSTKSVTFRCSAERHAALTTEARSRGVSVSAVVRNWIEPTDDYDDPETLDALELAELVARLHDDDQHGGSLRWCDREACRRAAEYGAAVGK